MAKSNPASALSAFTASTQGSVALAIALAYALSAFVFRVAPVHLAAGVLKLAIIVYTINCMVVGNCNVLSWTHVVGLALFCSADLFGVVHTDARLHAQTGGGGAFGQEPSKEFAEERPGFMAI